MAHTVVVAGGVRPGEGLRTTITDEWLVELGALPPDHRNGPLCFPCASQLRFPGSDADANSANLLIAFMVRAAGIEPALCRQNWILSPARLPVPPRPHEVESSSHSSCGATLLRLSIAPIWHESERQVQRSPAENPSVDIVYSAASFTGAGPLRNCSSRLCSSALAAFKCFVFTWP